MVRDVDEHFELWREGGLENGKRESQLGSSRIRISQKSEGLTEVP